MADVKSISEVKDLYDLIELYAELDRDADGLLGAGEVPAEDIAKGDRGGVGSANFDVKDGFLSPWEVAQMQGFKWEDVRPLRIANQIQGRAFQDIKHLTRDFRFKLRIKKFDAVCKAGTPMRFHKNGEVRSGVLAQDTSYGFDIVIPAGTSFSYDPDRYTYAFFISQDAEVIGHSMHAGTRIYTDLIGTTVIPPQDSPIMIGDIAYSKIYRKPIPYETRTLAKDARAHVFPGKSSLTASLPAGQDISVDKDTSSIVSFVLAEDRPLFGFECSKGVAFRARGICSLYTWYELIPEQDDSSIELNGNRVKKAKLMIGNSTIWEIEPETVFQLRIGNREYSFSSVRMNVEGRIVGGILAADIESPWGTGAMRAGSKVSFLDDGTLLDGSMKCFQSLHPGMSLEDATPEEVNAILLSMQHVPKHVLTAVRGILVVPRESSSYPNMDAWGYADRDTMKIFLTKESFRPEDDGSNASGCQHEAAHIFTFVQEESGNGFESEWMRAATMVDAEAYDKTIPREEGSLSVEWKMPDKKISLYQPRYGCARAYGCKNYREDVATHVELATNDHELYRELIDPKSMYYMMHPGEKKYAVVYRAKLDLLYKYRFISRENYRKIVPSAPPTPRMAAFCAHEGVNCP